MRKVTPGQWFMLTLPGLALLAVLFIGGRAEVFPEGYIPTTETQSVALRGNDTQFIAAHATCDSARRGPSFGNAVVVTSGEVICHDLTSFGGSVIIRGEVNGDVVAFAGNVVLDGLVHGNVTLYGGSLTLQDGAHVNGDIHVCGGSWTNKDTHNTHAQLHGNVFSCTQSLGGLFTRDSGTEVRFWSTLLWIVLGLVSITFLPEHVMLIRTTVKSKLRRSLALGVLSILLAPAILAVLVALIISIPLAILTIVVLIAAWTLGMVAIGWLIGDWIVRSVAPHYTSRLLQVIVGMAILALVGSLPLIGLWVQLGAGLIGLGAAFLSRFGTRLYGPPRQPLPL